MAHLSDILKDAESGTIKDGVAKIDNVTTLTRTFRDFVDCCYVDMQRTSAPAKEENLIIMLDSDLNDTLEFYRLSYDSTNERMVFSAVNESVLPRVKDDRPRREI